MTTRKISIIPPFTMPDNALYAEALALKLKMAAPAKRLKELLDEVKERDGKNNPDGDTRTHDLGNGISLVVTFPAPSREWIEDEASLRKIAGDQFRKLFAKQTGYQAVKDIVKKVEALLPKSHAKKVLALATKPSAPKAEFKFTKKGNS